MARERVRRERSQKNNERARIDKSLPQNSPSGDNADSSLHDAVVCQYAVRALFFGAPVIFETR